jgi:hypothetical protein
MNNKALKYALITFGANVVIFVLLIMIVTAFGDNLDVALALLLLVPIIALLGELILGIIFAVSKTKQNLGAGLLIGFLATLLIGLSVCGILAGM